MELALDSMALEMPVVSGHPNRMPFRGVLTFVDAPSDRPPAGARGRRVVLTRSAAEAAIASLLGMAVDYTPKLDGHDAKRKVGVITAAWISNGAGQPTHSERQRGSPFVSSESGLGRASSSRFALARDVEREPTTAAQAPSSEQKECVIEVEGHIFARDFPELARELAAHAGQLGMSYEVADAHVEDMRAPIWKLTQVTFTGAAILRKDKAAYNGTSFTLKNNAVIPSERAAAARESRDNALHKTGAIMNQQIMQQFSDAGARLAAAAEALEHSVARLDEQHKSIGEKLEHISATVTELAQEVGDDEAKTLYERVVELEKQNAELKAKADASAANPANSPATPSASAVVHAQALRKTLPATVSALLAKNGFDSGERIEIATLDKILSPLSIEQRIAVKEQMAGAGMIA